jgi:formylglycine-generating enzyme required for sulfatase activity
MMGSPLDEPGRSDDEVPHRVRIPRTYAIATIELTNQQFERFLADSPEFARRWRAATCCAIRRPTGSL